MPTKQKTNTETSDFFEFPPLFSSFYMIVEKLIFSHDHKEKVWVDGIDKLIIVQYKYQKKNKWTKFVWKYNLTNFFGKNV